MSWAPFCQDTGGLQLSSAMANPNAPKYIHFFVWGYCIVVKNFSWRRFIYYLHTECIMHAILSVKSLRRLSIFTPSQTLTVPQPLRCPKPTTWMLHWKLGSMVRINGLFRLLINVVLRGVITHWSKPLILTSWDILVPHTMKCGGIPLETATSNIGMSQNEGSHTVQAHLLVRWDFIDRIQV